jgi:predicted transcriptional regulator
MRTVDEDRSVQDVLDTIGDDYARQILASLSRESRAAKDLAEECDISLPTVYRRLEQLEEQELVTSRTETDTDGNEFQLYECNFESTLISLDDDEYDVRIYRKENLPSRFSQLWDDLQVE